jgi:hypothetical protein
MALNDFIRQPDEKEEILLEEEEIKPNPWMVINDIRNGTGLPDILVEFNYNPFLTNRALTYHSDTLVDAQLMNESAELPTLLQYDYLHNEVKKYKRPYIPWSKKEKFEEIELLMKYHNYNFSKVKDVLRIYTEEQLELIRYSMRIGGTSAKNKKIT